MTDADYRQWLNNFVGKRKLGELRWTHNDKPVPPKDHFWTTTVQCECILTRCDAITDEKQVNGTTLGKGTGWMKGKAEEKAAREALEALKKIHVKY